MRRGRPEYDFRLQLREGQQRERALVRALVGDRTEVLVEAKSQRRSTTHVFIEHENFGKASGIAISHADVYAIEVEQDVWILMPAERMRELHRRALSAFGERVGGQDMAAKGAIVPRSWLA